MNNVKRIASFIALGMLALSLAPTGAQAQQAVRSETVTVQVDVRTPAGTQITGTIVAQRKCSDSSSALTDLAFNGMVNGQPASASATGTETWSGNSTAEFNLISVSAWSIPLTKPSTLKLNIAQTAPGLISVNGVPVAIDGDLMAPCGGKTHYTVTNAGQSTGQIVLLPKTGAGPIWANPLFIVVLLVVPGTLMLVLSSLVRKMGERRATASVSVTR